MAPRDVLMEVRDWNRNMKRVAINNNRDDDAERHAANIRRLNDFIDFGSMPLPPVPETE